METYITISKDDIDAKVYVYPDGRYRLNGEICDDFAEAFIKLAGLGWRVTKEVNIAAASKAKETPAIRKAHSRRADFRREWFGLMDKLVTEGNLDHN